MFVGGHTCFCLVYTALAENHFPLLPVSLYCNTAESKIGLKWGLGMQKRNWKGMGNGNLRLDVKYFPEGGLITSLKEKGERKRKRKACDLECDILKVNDLLHFLSERVISAYL